MLLNYAKVVPHNPTIHRLLSSSQKFPNLELATLLEKLLIDFHLLAHLTIDLKLEIHRNINTRHYITGLKKKKQGQELN